MSRWNRRVAGLTVAIVMVLSLVAAACSGSARDAETPDNSPIDGSLSQPPVMVASEVLDLSSQRSLEVESFRGTYQMAMTSGGFTMEMAGDFLFQAPYSMYMTMDFLGQTMEMLMILPDMYVNVPDEGWYVVDTADAAGIDWDVYTKWLEQQGPLDYSSMAKQLEHLTQLPDDTIDGVPYLHYQGDLDFADAMEEIPEGLMDPAVLDAAAGAVDAINVEVWLHKDTYLPLRYVMSIDYSSLAGSPPFSMTMSMRYFDYNEPVDIPEPPADAKLLDPAAY